MLAGVPPSRLAARVRISEAELYEWCTHALSGAEAALEVADCKRSALLSPEGSGRRVVKPQRRVDQCCRQGIGHQLPDPRSASWRLPLSTDS
jgi:hypothetical protein